MTTWPEWYPPECPPKSAESATGSFFRLVDGEQVTAVDFLSNRELVDQGIKTRVHWTEDAEYLAVACSVHAAKQDAERTRNSFGALRKKRLALGPVDGDGRIMNTPAKNGPSHHSWWRPTGDEAWKSFEVLS